MTSLMLLLLLLRLLQVIRLKAALNEKDMELIELREQHMQLVVSCRRCQQQHTPLNSISLLCTRCLALAVHAACSKSKLPPPPLPCILTADNVPN
jgi:hypothetical protein